MTFEWLYVDYLEDVVDDFVELRDYTLKGQKVIYVYTGIIMRP